MTRVDLFAARLKAGVPVVTVSCWWSVLHSADALAKCVHTGHPMPQPEPMVMPLVPEHALVTLLLVTTAAWLMLARARRGRRAREDSVPEAAVSPVACQTPGANTLGCWPGHRPFRLRLRRTGRWGRGRGPSRWRGVHGQRQRGSPEPLACPRRPRHPRPPRHRPSQVVRP